MTPHELAEANKGLIHRFAVRYSHFGGMGLGRRDASIVDYDDLWQEGWLGLYNAASLWLTGDQTRDFHSLACSHIRDRVVKCAFGTIATVKLNWQIRKRAREVRTAAKAIQDATGFTPSVYEVVDRINPRPSLRVRYLAIARMVLADALDWDEERDSLCRSTDDYRLVDARLDAASLLDMMKPEQADAARRVFGIPTGQERKLRDVAGELGVSYQCVQNRINRGFARALAEAA